MANTFISSISKKRYPLSEKVSGASLRESIIELIRKDHPDFDQAGDISVEELDDYRERYISQHLAEEKGRLTKLEKKVLRSMQDGTVISEEPTDEADSAGDRIADKVAAFGGSWKFILLFASFIVFWILLNVLWLFNSESFDPYPFILLNLILSCLSALQAPVIMMSQNRQSNKDRARARNDYQVNLKSELEIRILNEKLDHLMMNQQQRLLEIQRMQVDMLMDIKHRIDETRSSQGRSVKKPLSGNDESDTEPSPPSKHYSGTTRFTK